MHKFDKILGSLSMKNNLDLEDPMTVLLYDIKSRQEVHNMIDGMTYWENYKLIYNTKDSCKYTQYQLYNINIVLNSEFDPIVLKCLTQ